MLSRNLESWGEKLSATGVTSVTNYVHGFTFIFLCSVLIQISYRTILIPVPCLYSWLCIFYQGHGCLASQRHSCLDQKGILGVIWIPHCQTSMTIDSVGSYVGQFYGFHEVLIKVCYILTSLLSEQHCILSSFVLPQPLTRVSTVLWKCSKP